MIYTKNGDGGFSRLFKKQKILKSDLIFEVLGTLDELNCFIGYFKSQVEFSSDAKKIILGIQKDLLEIGSRLAEFEDNKDNIVIKVKNSNKNFNFLTQKTAKLESYIDDLEKSLPKIVKFIIPGFSKQSSSIHYTRTVCRRFERRLVSYFKDYISNNKIDTIKPLLAYTNRLSDFFFVLARFVNENI